MIKKALRVFVAVRDRLKKFISQNRKKTFVFVDKRPLTSFFALLTAIVLLILLSNFINKPQDVISEKALVAKSVETYRIGSAPKITVQAKTIKSGVIQINALSNGVVNQIYQYEGNFVYKGSLLLGMSSNYQGGNILSAQREIASIQYDNISNTYSNQKDIIQKQKDLVNKTDENSDQLRDITAKSIDETKSLIVLNEDILVTLDQTINELTQTGSNPTLLLSTKQIRSQFAAATNSAKSSLRSIEQSSAGDKPFAQISDLQKDITLKQLDIQDKQLDLSKEVSRLLLAIAKTNENSMFPTTPFNGTVQRVLVKENQAVSPGTPLMILSQEILEEPISAVAFVSQDIAKKISILEPSILHIGNNDYSVQPSFVSTEAVEGTLYAVYFPIPDSLNDSIVSEGYISVDIPIGYFDTSEELSFIPLDSVYQTQEKSYIFAVENGKAKSKTVKLGLIYGRFAEVLSGIEDGDEIILNRNVVDGDLVTIN